MGNTAMGINLARMNATGFAGIIVAAGACTTTGFAQGASNSKFPAAGTGAFPATGTGEFEPVLTPDIGADAALGSTPVQSPAESLTQSLMQSSELALPLAALGALVLIGAAWLFFKRRRGGGTGRPVTSRQSARALGGLCDRTAFIGNLTELLAGSERQGRHLALHIIDFDGFGAINRTYGYEAGDALLSEAANRLGQMAAGPNCLARLGSDEIAVIQSDSGATRTIDEYAERLHEALCRPVTLAGDPISPRVSIGTAVAPQHGSDAASLLKSADLALTSAKEEGGNRSVHFGPSSRIGRAMRSQEETLLRSALSNGWVKAYLQPIFDLRERQLMGFEALARIEHPERGLIAPDAFLPIAEETGLIEPLAGIVHRQAMEAAADWPDHLDLAINLSPAEFRNTNVAGTIRDALAESGLPPKRVMLEVTERLFSGNATAPAEQLQALKATGVSLALDDFGLGLAALTHLCAHEFDVVKIDRTVVRALSSERAARLVSVMMQAANDLDIMVIAEGVETAEQVQVLANRGCFRAQGDLFSVPLPIADVAPIIMKDVKYRTTGAKNDTATNETAPEAASDGEEAKDTTPQQTDTDIARQA